MTRYILSCDTCFLLFAFAAAKRSAKLRAPPLLPPAARAAGAAARARPRHGAQSQMMHARLAEVRAAATPHGTRVVTRDTGGYTTATHTHRHRAASMGASRFIGQAQAPSSKKKKAQSMLSLKAAALKLES